MARAEIIDGRRLAADLRGEIRDAVQDLRGAHHLRPGLAVVQIGENPASSIYVRNKAEQTEAVGMCSFVHRLPTNVRQADLVTLIRGLNMDHRVHGILVQLPLPAHIEEASIIEAIDPAKDVDGFHVINTGRAVTGAGQALLPCTPIGCLLMIKSYKPDIIGDRAVVVGRSNIVGKPMATLLLGENCTVTVAHSRTRDLADECRRADILVAAIGRVQMIRGDWIKPGAIVVDVGINRMAREDGKTVLMGDVAFDEAVEVAGAITPVPGGVGPMTIACLLRNTVIAACRQHGLDSPLQT